MSDIDSENMRLKNESLLELCGQHVLIAFDLNDGRRYIAGVLELDRGGENNKEWPLPLRWRIAVHRPPKFRHYRSPEHVFFTTCDVQWWAPVEPKEPKEEAKP